MPLRVIDLGSSFNTGSHRSRILEQGMNPGHRPGGIGQLAGDNFHTAGGVGDDDVITQHFADHADSQSFGAADTSAVTGGESFFGINGGLFAHYSLTP